MKIAKRVTRQQLVTSAILFALVFTLVNPEGLGRIWPKPYQYIYVYGRYFAYVAILLLFAFRITGAKGFRYDLKHLIVPVFAFFPLVTTVLNGGRLVTWVNYYSVCIMTMLLIEVFRENIRSLISTYLVILEFWICINFLSMLLYPGGMYYTEANGSYNCWIFGYKSSFQYYILPAMCLEWINTKYRKQKARMFAVSCICMYEAVMSGNMMLAVGLAGFLVIFFFRLYRFRIFNLRNYLIAVLAVNAALLFFFSLFSDTEIMGKFLSLVGKDSTLSSRASIIWPVTIKSIAQKPLIGYGLMQSADRAAMYGFSGGIHAHNQILEIAFVGGFAMVGLYVALNVVLWRYVRKNRNEASCAVSAGIFIIYMMACVEIYTLYNSSSVWLIILLGFFAKNIDLAYSTPIDKSIKSLFPHRRMNGIRGKRRPAREKTE